MAPVYLPDTAVASLAIGNLVYTYAQTVDVILIECKGTSSTAAQICNCQGQSEIICHYEDDGVRHDAPKFPKMFPFWPWPTFRTFTPKSSLNVFLDLLNVADIKQYLIYVDDKNFIRDVYSTGSDWIPGNLF
jgi:hypothetical protein